MSRFRVRATLIYLALACCACGGPASVADKFVDKYYVESDQTGALQYTDGVATLKLKDELKLSAEARTPGMELVSRQERVYYERAPLAGEGDSRKVDYKLDIRPQGGGKLQREAHLELQRGAQGWKVTRFNETQPH